MCSLSKKCNGFFTERTRKEWRIMTNRIPKIIVREQEKASNIYEVISSVPSSGGRFRQVVLRSDFSSKRGARGWSKTVEARIMAMIAKETVRLITEAGPDQSGLE